MGGVKVALVKWADVCKAKSASGLGVKDLRFINLTLLVSGGR